MDDRIEALQNKLILWTLICWNKLTDWAAKGWNKTCITWDAICEAHKEERFIFIDSNTNPYCVRGDVDSNLYGGMLTFCPNTNQFVSCGRLQPPLPLRFDLVHLSCERGNGEPALDLTGFFHDVSWRQGGAPSLVEMILLYGMLYEPRPFTLAEILFWTLVALDSDAEEHRIPLTSNLARNRFTGWT